jgi:hypothetical protein
MNELHATTVVGTMLLSSRKVSVQDRGIVADTSQNDFSLGARSLG